MPPSASHAPLFSLFPPYRNLDPLCPPEYRLPSEAPPGGVLLWLLQGGDWHRTFEAAKTRPGGMALIVVLPDARVIEGEPNLLRVIELCRPQSVLPFHPEPNIGDLCALLRRPPDDLGVEVNEYLAWRGLEVDRDTRRLMGRIIELSAELRTISGLSRSLYTSRRALGRRFLSRGIPVPSHWLHFGRVLRACIRLQNSDASLFAVASETGYPDGFALSNQMKRLTSLRPAQVRDHLGWEWIVEAWFRVEALEGGVSPDVARLFIPPQSAQRHEPVSAPRKTTGPDSTVMAS